jgi:glycine cleavage system regulatory protein
MLSWGRPLGSALGSVAVCLEVNMPSLVMTLIGADRPGLVQLVAALVAEHGASWLESRMAHLAGQFAGILRIDVPDHRADDLIQALEQLDRQGLRVIVQKDLGPEPDRPMAPLRMELVGNDRPGIVREVSRVLAQRQVNVEDFQTECISAPMSGEKLFRAAAWLRLPAELTRETLQQDLEQIAHDLMVDIQLVQSGLP